ncbi:MAG: PaaI family thioesterase [Pseudomonadota bacterium]
MPIAEKPEDLLDLKSLLSISGLDYMLGMQQEKYPGPPIARTMGYTLHTVEPNRVVFRGAPGFAVTNPMGSVHGGWYGTLLDSAMACAVMTTVPKGSVYTTLEYKVNLTRAIPVDMMIDCIGEIDHAGRSTAVASGEIRGVDDGKLYATGSTTCIIMDMTNR